MRKRKRYRCLVDRHHVKARRRIAGFRAVAIDDLVKRQLSPQAFLNIVERCEMGERHPILVVSRTRDIGAERTVRIDLNQGEKNASARYVQTRVRGDEVVAGSNSLAPLITDSPLTLNRRPPSFDAFGSMILAIAVTPLLR